MKTIKITLILALCFTMLNSFATPLNPVKSSKNVTSVKFDNVKKGHQVTIFDKEDNVLFQEEVNANGSYNRNFNLTALESGTYSIELDQDIKIVTKYFTVQNGTVIFNNNLEQVFYKPIAIITNNQLKISQLSSTDEVLDVSIYYNNELIHEDSLSDATILKRMYLLSEDKKGDYTVIMKSYGKTFYKNFNL